MNLGEIPMAGRVICSVLMKRREVHLDARAGSSEPSKESWKGSEAALERQIHGLRCDSQPDEPDVHAPQEILLKKAL